MRIIWVLTLFITFGCINRNVILISNEFSTFDKYFISIDSISSLLNGIEKGKAISINFHDNGIPMKKENLKILILNDSNLSYLLSNNIIDSIWAIGKIKINKNIDGYIVKYKGEPTCQETGIFLYLFQNNRQISHELKLLGGYASEGIIEITESWLLDYNYDGKSDFLIGDFYERIGLDSTSFEGEYHLWILETDSFKESKINNIDSLKNRFNIIDYRK